MESISLHLGVQKDSVTCLNEGIANEIAIDILASDTTNKLTALRENFSDLSVDFNLVPSEGRRKKLLIRIS